MKIATNLFFLLSSLRTKFFLCFTFLFFQLLFTQQLKSQGIGHLTLCRLGVNTINFESSGFLWIQFFDQEGNFLGGQNIIIKDGKFEVNIQFPDNISEGYYNIESAGSYFYENTFSVTDCYDELVFDTSCTFFLPKQLVNLTDSVPAKQVCLGDTTEFFIKNADPNKLKPQAPFTLDRIQFFVKLGKIIYYDSLSFKIVWNKPGLEIISFSKLSHDAQGGENFSIHNFFIKDTSTIEVKNLNGTNEICLNETLNLEISANNDIHPVWELSDGRVMDGFTNQLNFQKTGDYTIKIFDDDDCTCTPPVVYNVKVKDGTAPKIVCKRTVCIGEAVTYYSQEECTYYLWNVSAQGTIMEGGGTGDFYVTVQWNDGPIGEISLSTPGCIADACNEKTTELISIIPPSLTITGQDTVCTIAISKYSIPDFTGTQINWSVSNNAIILQGQNTNTIYVQWLYNGAGKVSVNYENCIVGCSGSATMDVVVLGEFNIETYKNHCLNSTAVFYSSQVDWKVIYPNGSVKEYTNIATIAFLTNQIGKYSVIAINKKKNTCNEIAEYSFEVRNDLPVPTDIEGPTITCTFEASTYAIPNLSPSHNVRWTIMENGVSKIFETRELEYTWKSNGPYKVSATLFDPYTGCESLPIEKEFKNEIKLLGKDTVCLHSTETYQLDNFNVNNFSASISPVNNNYTMVSSEPDSITIIWNQTGKYTINTNQCGIKVSKEITVLDNPKYVLNFTDTICKGGTSILNTSPNSGERFMLVHKDETKEEITLPKNISGGSYGLSFKDKNECEFYEKFSITEREKPKVFLSLSKDYTECKPFDPYYLQANILPGSYTYEWYKNSLPLGINNAYINVTDYGLYHVIATDIYGCQSKSDSLILNEYCPVITGPGGGSPGGGEPLKPKVSGCKNLTFELVPPFDSLNAHWYLGSTKIGTGTKFTYTFDKVGKFTIFVSKCELTFDANGNPIAKCTTESFDIVINFIPEFEIEPGCINTPTKFLNKTQFLYPNTISYLWNFDDAASGVNNTSTLEYPLHTYTKPGKYTVTLTVTDTSGCAITVAEEVEIYPDLDLKIISDTIACFGNQIDFYMANTNSNFTYEWNFGDKNSYADNYSKESTPSHNFSGLGSYNVILSANDDRGCTYTTTKNITITSIEENVNILASDNVKCPNDTLTLKTNKPFYKYKWNTGDTTATIKVIEPNQYIVTVYNEAGCSKVSSSKLIQDHYIVNTTVFAQERDLERSIYFDTITICKGDSFDLKCTEVAQGRYKWSNGYNGGPVLKYETYFKNLNAGTYEYYVDVENNECEYTTDKFVVVILGLPDKPIIKSNTNNCENQETILTIDNFNNSYAYKWNNGDKNKSTSVYSSGKYLAVVTDAFGCKSLSDEIIIHPIPKVSGWMTGCMDVCFPRDFCLNLPPENTYNLFHDGTDVGILTATGGMANFTEPGDYQIEASNAFGCKTRTDVLTLTSMPVDQSLSGFVYLDINSNDIFDSTDTKIANGRLWLMNGNTIVEETKTDTSGFYIFDSLTQNNLKVVLDPNSVPYLPKSYGDSLLIFKTCIEEKTIDFPLTKNCIPIVQQQSYLICKGASLTIHGKTYTGFALDTISLFSQAGCDSLINIEIIEFPKSEIEIFSHPSCALNANGSIEVSSLTNEDLVYGLSLSTFSSNSGFADLSEGTYTLYYKNNNGCIDSQLFTIDKIIQPGIDYDIESSCADENTGKLMIDYFGNEQLIYQINNTGPFTEVTTYFNLAAGYHILSYMDQYGCSYEVEFEVPAFDKAIYNVESHPACFNQKNGSVEIKQNQGIAILFSLNNKNNFVDTNSIKDLVPDHYTLYALDEFGCIDSTNFVIEALPKPDFSLEIKASCANTENGQLTIFSTEELKYSINNQAFDTITNFTDLKAGNYLLSITTEDACNLDTNLMIESLPMPVVTASSQKSCQNEATGEIILNITAQDPIILWQGGWTSDTIFKNLSPDNYTFKIKDRNNCEATIIQVVESLLPLEVDMPGYGDDCLDEATLILPEIISHQGSLSYLWNDGSTEPQLLAASSGNYEVTITDDCDTRSLQVEMNISVFNENNTITIGNIFYPDSKIGNNCFKPILNQEYEFLSYLFSIYDRWGNLVFISNSSEECWDGTIKSCNAELDVYVYVLEAVIKKCQENKSVKFIGDVTLIR